MADLKRTADVMIEVELYTRDDGKQGLFLSHDGSSGCKYTINSIEDLKQKVAEYVEMAYLDCAI